MLRYNMNITATDEQAEALEEMNGAYGLNTPSTRQVVETGEILIMTLDGGTYTIGLDGYVEAR